MDPNACMQRLMRAIEANDREECANATEDLARWLRSGGFAPTFTSDMAGKTKYGELRRYIRLGNYCIQTIAPHDDSEGWEFVAWHPTTGARIRGYLLNSK